MAKPPDKTPLFHMTHISRLETIVRNGLMSDALVAKIPPLSEQEWLSGSIGHPDIKMRRAGRGIPDDVLKAASIPPQSWMIPVTVADFVPFYFIVGTPMLHNLSSGKVPSYKGTQDEILYLATSVKHIQDLDLKFVFSDRNAAVWNSNFSGSIDNLDTFVNWKLLDDPNSLDDDDPAVRATRIAERMAEFLVHRCVPFSAIFGIATQTDEMLQRVNDIVGSCGATVETVAAPQWYFT